MDYDELTAIFTAFQARRDEFASYNRAFANTVVGNIYGILNCPKSYNLPPSSGEVQRRYVGLLKCDDDGYEKVDRASRAVTFDEHGARVGIFVVLETAPNSFPKTNFQVDLRFLVSTDKVRFEVNGNERSFHRDQLSLAAKECAISILDGIRAFLERPIDDRYLKRRLGFEISGQGESL